MDIKDDIELRKEFIEYRFPNQGGESIQSRLDRYIQIVNTDSSTDLLQSNEEIYKSSYVIKKNELGNEIAIYNINSKNALDEKDYISITEPTKSMLMTIIHHNDLDGLTSAAIAGMAFSKHLTNNRFKNLTFLQYNYSGKKIENYCTKLIEDRGRNQYKVAIIVDLNLKEEDINQVLQAYNKVIWIDHHQSSIDTVKKVNVPQKKQFLVMIDTSFSASYLSYVLFNDLIEKMADIKINPTIPTIVSMFDTKLSYSSYPKFINVLITESNFKKLIGTTYKKTLGGTAIFVNKTDKHLIGKRVYIENKDRQNQKFATGYRYGLDLNQFFNDMGGFEPYSPIWQSILTNDSILSKIIEKGSELRTIMLQRANVTWEEEVKYIAYYRGMTITAIASANSTKFLAEHQKPSQSVRIIMSYLNSSVLTAGIYTDDVYLKQANLNSIINSIYPNSGGGGHPGAAGVSLNINHHEELLNFVKNNKKSTLQLTCPKINTLYKHIIFDIQPGKEHYRYDSHIYNVFRIVAAILFSKWEEAAQKSIR